MNQTVSGADWSAEGSSVTSSKFFKFAVRQFVGTGCAWITVLLLSTAYYWSNNDVSFALFIVTASFILAIPFFTYGLLSALLIEIFLSVAKLKQWYWKLMLYLLMGLCAPWVGFIDIDHKLWPVLIGCLCVSLIYYIYQMISISPVAQTILAITTAVLLFPSLLLFFTLLGESI
ncbi:hypothetical protein K0T92_22855 [Paenibacillus oenotherae]|uniref:Uncharacterized protein n=1 Tax=Paenibacillus oenotherae TaxID=1435645 RepID=A0ABS7DEF8_9BACL|nr:hypothetical protein [Paenibacillus oenotherae]MBW7477563.1 hypothetical protein [Paenibacillus oenotherae]